MRATKVGSDTVLAQIVQMVQEAQNSKAPAQLLADKASQWLVVIAIVIGLLTFAVWFWWIGSPLLFALTLTITVFVIACPDALGLATPMAVMVGTGLGATHGILFKNAGALEDATKLDVIVFDLAAVLAQVRGDPVAAHRRDDLRRAHRIGMIAAARVADGCDVIDIDAEAKSAGRHGHATALSVSYIAPDPDHISPKSKLPSSVAREIVVSLSGRMILRT